MKHEKDIILLELFSGTGGFAKGFQDAGYNIIRHFFSEVDKHAIANYRHNFKNSEYIGTVTNVRHIIRIIESARQGQRLVITFGSPCQDFSLAGNRTDLEGGKSSLIKYALFLVRWLRPDIYIWENVKGAFSTNNGADYWAIIQAFANIPGYGREQQLLNTSWVLPQNRERIYFVGHLAGRSRPGIFPIREPIKLHNETRSQKPGEIASTLNAGDNKSWVGNFIQVRALTETRTGDAKQIRKESMKNGRDFSPRLGKELAERGDSNANTVTCVQGFEQLIQIKTATTAIRRLTEIECERLQGFPDNWTAFGIYDEVVKPIPKTQRYKLCGNAVTVKIIELIASRIEFMKPVPG